VRSDPVLISHLTGSKHTVVCLLFTSVMILNDLERSDAFIVNQKTISLGSQNSAYVSPTNLLVSVPISDSMSIL